MREASWKNLWLGCTILALGVGASAQAQTGDLCPYDTTGAYHYNPDLQFYGDGLITMDYSNTWYMDDTYACYEVTQTPSYLVYFPKCDIDGNGVVTMSEVYDIYYRMHPLYQYDQIAGKACIAGFPSTSFFYCTPSRYNRTVTDIEAIRADYPATDAIYDGVSAGGLGQAPEGPVEITCSVPAGSYVPIRDFDVLKACYPSWTSCDDQNPANPWECGSVTAHLYSPANFVRMLPEFEAVVAPYGGWCTTSEIGTMGSAGFQYRKYNDDGWWQWRVRTTAQCSGSDFDSCACHRYYALWTHPDHPGTVWHDNDTDYSTGSCTDCRFTGGDCGDCTDADGDGYGVGTSCLGPDCDDSVAACNTDCVTDVDNDGIRDCEDTCIDVDGDGYCTGNDCDDTVAACNVDCTTDVDNDGIRDCEDTCIDVDGGTPGQPNLEKYDVGGPNEIGNPYFFAELGGMLYFAASSEGYGMELMVYDPVAEQVSLAADLWPGMGSGDPRDITAHRGKLYFSARSGSTDVELHVYDPQAGGSVTEIDIKTNGSSRPDFFFSASDGNLYFGAGHDTAGRELWGYDPDVGGVGGLTMYEIYPGADPYGNAYGGSPRYMVEYQQVIYMQANGPEGQELYSFDLSTKETPQMLFNIHLGYHDNGWGLGSYPKYLMVFNDEIFFNAAAARGDEELWIYTPGGGVRQKVIDPGVKIDDGDPAGGAPNDFTVLGNRLYFSAAQVTEGVELWVYDPVTDAVTMEFDSYPGQHWACFGYAGAPPCGWAGNNGMTSYLVTLNGKFYYTGVFENQELWEYDPATGHGEQIAEIFPGLDGAGNPNHGFPFQTTAFNGELFFRASDPTSVNELFRVHWCQ